MNRSVTQSDHSPIFSSTLPHFTSTSINVAANSEKAITTTGTTNARPSRAATHETTTTTTSSTTVTRTTFITGAAAALRTSTNLVGYPFQNDYQWIAEGDKTPSSSEDNFEAESEMGLLWLPYVIFTIVLLGLIAMSFVRFHCQRGDQYRRRRSELEDKVPPTPAVGDRGVLGAASSPYQPNGGSAVEAGRPVRCDVPEHMVLFLQFTETETPSGNGSGSQDDQSTGTKRIGSTRRVFGFKAQSKVPSVDTALGGGGGGSDGGGGGSDGGGCKQQRGVTCHRRPLTFTFNINGSMVDIRCSDEERTKTFHLSARAGSEKEGGTGSAAAAPEMVDPSGDRFCLSAAVVGDEEDGRRCPGNYRETPRAATATTTTTTLSSSSRRSSSNKTQGYARGGGGGGGGGGEGVGCSIGGVGISPQQKVLMYSMTTAGNCELRQNSSSADEALFLLHPSRS